jgi:hypothetical protein
MSIIAAAVALMQSVVFANTLNGGDFTVATNWSDGFLPTNSLTPGIIDASVTDGTWASNPASGLSIQQTGGDVSRSTFGWQDFSGMNYEITGGTFTAGSFGMRLLSSSVFTMNGGALSMATALNVDTSTFTMNGGTLTAKNVQFKNAIFNFNGGVVNLTTEGLTASGKSSGTATVNFSGDVDFNTTAIQKGNGTAINFTIGAGTGTIDADTLTPDGLSFNWIPGSEFTFTVANSTATTWGNIWNAGQMTYDGNDYATLGDWAAVTAADGLEAGVRFVYDDATATLSLGSGGAAPTPTPTGLTATGGFSVVELDWDDSGAEVASYKLYRTTESNSFGSVLASNLTVSAYSDSAIINGTNYYYRVTAVGINGAESGYSDQVSATPVLDLNGPPPAPTGLTATDGISEVTLDWNDSDDFVASYNVYRSTTSGGFNSNSAAIATDVIVSSYTDSTGTADLLYYYAVTAVGTNGVESAFSAEDSATAVGLSTTTFTNAFNTVSDPDNWDNGLPNTIGKSGIINTNATLDATVLEGYDVSHTGGTVNGSSVKFLLGTDSSWVTDGADAVVTSRGMTLENGAVFTLNAGTADIGLNTSDSAIQSGSEVIINGGTMTIGRKLSFRTGGGLTVNGGALSVATDLYSDHLSGSGSVLNFNGGATTVGGNLAASHFEMILNFGGSSTGSLTVDGTLGNVDKMVMNWLPGSAMSVTISGTNEWAEVLWNSGQLTYNGSGTNELGKTWAEVTASGGLGSGMNFIYNSTTETLSLVIPTDKYELWAAGWGANIGAKTNDYDGDGLANLYEYGVNGDPTDDQDQGTAPIFTKLGDSLIYVHPRRSDDALLTYTVETTTNLMDSVSWSAAGYTVSGTLEGNPVDMVTNIVNTVESEQFIRLKIEL